MKTINIRFPLQDDVEKNRFFAMNSVTKNALSSNLLLLLLTEKGERYYNPNYGTNLKKFLFEPKDSDTIDDIEEDIKLTVKEFIPQLTIQSVQFFTDTDDTGDSVGDNEIRVLVKFTYTEDVFSSVDSVELSF